MYSLSNEMISSGGVFLGYATNNTGWYHAVIGLLTDTSSNGIDCIIFHLGSQLVVSHLNRVYTVHDHMLLRLFL